MLRKKSENIRRSPFRLPLPVCLAGLFLLLALSSCSYDEGADSFSVTVRLSEALEAVPVQMTNTLSQTFTAETDETGKAFFTLPSGVYTASVSKTVDDGYVRKVFNGTKSDIVVSGAALDISLDVVTATIQINNPLLIKELYVGGCQKDDGSGIFAMDKCIILYNNSSEAASLDNVAIGMIEPYNAEASSHDFLIGGRLTYEDEDWIPAINGIWYFQDGNTIPPYSELVVNICGAIDNTQTYANSINYADPSYYCMYDVEASSTDGGKYNNTKYYPSPSEAIPTSRYLKAVKFGQGNAWPFSQTSPAVILFRTEEGSTPASFGGRQENIIYPANRQGNIIYACLKVPRRWVLDAVEVYNADKLSTSRKRLTSDLDNGYVKLTSGYGHSLVRKVEKTIDGHNIYQDTNNSTNDFDEIDNCSLR